MDWQLILSGLVIVAAIAFIVRRGVLVLRPSKKGCGGGCGCAKTNHDTPTALIAPEDLVLRRPASIKPQMNTDEHR